jgi:hypothetical protein
VFLAARESGAIAFGLGLWLRLGSGRRLRGALGLLAVLGLMHAETQRSGQVARETPLRAASDGVGQALKKLIHIHGVARLPFAAGLPAFRSGPTSFNPSNLQISVIPSMDKPRSPDMNRDICDF